jgi:hypothetical protein
MDGDDQTPAEAKHVVTGDPSTSPSRSAGAVAGGCLIRLVFLWIEVTVGIAFAYLIAQQIAPALAARGYDTKMGAGVFIAMGLGGLIVLYPMLWIHRFARSLAARL